MNKDKGFSIIELLVAMGIFSLLITTITSIFIGAMKNQVNVLANERLVGEIRYVTENISRLAMLARTDEEGWCVDPGETYQFTAGEFSFIDYENKCNIYSIESGSMYKRLAYDNGNVYAHLTSPEITIEEFSVEIMEDPHERVLIFIRMSVDGVKSEAQTTFSKRTLK